MMGRDIFCFVESEGLVLGFEFTAVPCLRSTAPPPLAGRRRRKPSTGVVRPGTRRVNTAW